MTIEIWLAFVTASVVLCLTPGPIVILIIGQALIHGKQSVIPLAAGALLGDAILMAASFMGLGLLLSVSATMFTLIKLAGAVYLIYLGVKALRTNARLVGQNSKVANRGGSFRIFRDALLVTALNPKGILFFMAFLPLFISTTDPMLPQMLILGTSFLTISLVGVTFYASLSGYLREYFADPKVHDIFNKLGGGLLVSAGVITASLQKT